MGKSQQLTSLLDLQRVVEREGVFVSKEVNSQTVWDVMAQHDPLHAAISAQDERTELAKSKEQIEQLVKLVTKSTVFLDIGCGYGRLAKYLLPTNKLGGYVGVDSSYTMLRLFKERYDASVAERATPALFVNSDISQMPLKASSVDLACTSAVFLHNHKSVIYSAMVEVERVLKPGGLLVALSSFPRRATAMGIQGMAYQAYLNIAGDPTRNGPVRYYSKREVMALFRNFSQVTIIPHGFSVMPKSILGLRGFPDRIFRAALSNPINAALAKLLPPAARSTFAVHYDVIAQK